MIGLLGFWNKKKRIQITKLIEKELKDCFIEEISFFTAKKIGDNKYIIFTKIRKNDLTDWTCGFSGFDLNKNYFVHNWIGYNRF